MKEENQKSYAVQGFSYEILDFEPKLPWTPYRLLMLMAIRFTRHCLVNLFFNSYQIVIKEYQKFPPLTRLFAKLIGDLSHKGRGKVHACIYYLSPCGRGRHERSVVAGEG